MGKHSVALGKMKTVFGSPVEYFFKEEEDLLINDLIGKNISLQFKGKINCISCNTPIKKTYGQGFCYPCFISAPEASDCIIRPELCKGHLGEGRDVEWEEKNHVKPHVVYLAASSAIKVGVTRETQVPYRWIDQGATKAKGIVYCPNRYEAGRIEVLLKGLFTDKTSWQKMLKNDVNLQLDLELAASKALDFLGDQIGVCEVINESPTEIHYPVMEYPEKVKSLKLDKFPQIEGELRGIKGQYLLFDDNRVMNIRSHAGYTVDLEF